VQFYFGSNKSHQLKNIEVNLMEEFKIYLGETGHNSDKKMRLIFGSFGILYLILGAIAYFTPFKSGIMMFIIGGVFLILYTIGSLVLR
jgi:uncharacterized membrane protein HdeD (DUF308 family)